MALQAGALFPRVIWKEARRQVASVADLWQWRAQQGGLSAAVGQVAGEAKARRYRAVQVRPGQLFRLSQQVVAVAPLAQRSRGVAQQSTRRHGGSSPLGHQVAGLAHLGSVRSVGRARPPDPRNQPTHRWLRHLRLRCRLYFLSATRRIVEKRLGQPPASRRRAGKHPRQGECQAPRRGSLPPTGGAGQRQSAGPAAGSPKA